MTFADVANVIRAFQTTTQKIDGWILMNLSCKNICYAFNGKFKFNW